MFARFFTSLRFRLVIIFMIIGVLPLIITGFVNIRLSNDVIRERVIQDEQSRLQVKVASVERFLETTEADLAFLSQSDRLKRMAAAIAEKDSIAIQPARREVTLDFENFLRYRRVGDELLYTRVRFLDQDGFEFVRLDTIDGEVRMATNLNFRTEEAYFTEAKTLAEGEIYSSTVTLVDEFGRIKEPYAPVIYYSTPVYVDDQFVGVIVTDLNAQGFLDLIQTGVAEDTLSYLVDQDGYYLSHPDTSLLFGRDLETNIKIQTHDPNEAMAIRTVQAGFLAEQDEIVVYQPIILDEVRNIRWFVFSVRPLSAVLEPVDQQRNTLLLAVIVIGLPVLLLALYLANSISNPIVNLTQTAALITRGDFRRRVYIHRRDELGQLATSFNTMTDQLSSLINNLEGHVANRTRDLQVAADVSKQVVSVLDINTLLQQVADLTAKQFNFYAAFVFLWDDDKEVLICAAGTSVTTNGIVQSMRIKDIPIHADPSIIAQAARTRLPMVINDVTKSHLYLPVESLPNTRSEVAIPMLLGDRLMGIFDLQANTDQRFQPDDVNVLTSLAEQIAIAVRNAQLFQEAKDARRAAEEANEIKSQFLANMSHELRTPLNAILNFSEFVADGLLGEVNEQQEETLQKVIHSAEHLLSLINDVLDLAKIEVGMMELFIEEVDLNQELKTVLATGKGLVKQRKVELKSEVETDLPKIAGDSRRLRQVMLNLLSNAIKFTPEGTVTLVAHHENGQIHLAVKDTGVGIPPEEHDLIFDNFHQVKQNAKVSTGTGLGLPITKYFVEAHGGKIWVESTVGTGTTIHVTLPVQSPVAREETADVHQ